MSTLGCAQENIARPLPGAKDIGLLGNWTSTGGTSTYSLTLEGGYYLTESLIATARFGLIKHSPQQTLVFVGARYEFKVKGASVPYVLAGIEFHSADRGNTTMSAPFVFDPDAGPRATFIEGGLGVERFFSSHSAFFAELIAFKASGGHSVGTDLQVGMRFFFK